MIVKLMTLVLIFAILIPRAEAAPMTPEDHKACLDGVTAMVFFRFMSLLGAAAEKRIMSEEAQGKRPMRTRKSYTMIEKSDCQAARQEYPAINQKFSRLSQACRDARTTEQFAAIYSDEDSGIDPKGDIRKQLNDKIHELVKSDDDDLCQNNEKSVRTTLDKLKDAKNAGALCEISVDGLKNLGVVMDECQAKRDSKAKAAPPDSCEIAEADGLCSNSKIRGTATPAAISNPAGVSDFEKLKANCLEFGANGGCVRTRSSSVGR